MKRAFYLSISLFIAFNSIVESSFFTYGSVHSMGGRPMAGIGLRSHQEVYALDLSLNMASPYSSKLFHVKSLCLIYPGQSSLYLGGGLGVLNDPESIHFSGSFESALGFQLADKAFLEANAIIPFKKDASVGRVWPGVTLGYRF
jgi:hypothetical protein